MWLWAWEVFYRISHYYNSHMSHNCIAKEATTTTHRRGMSLACLEGKSCRTLTIFFFRPPQFILRLDNALDIDVKYFAFNEYTIVQSSIHLPRSKYFVTIVFFFAGISNQFINFYQPSLNFAVGISTIDVSFTIFIFLKLFFEIAKLEKNRQII